MPLMQSNARQTCSRKVFLARNFPQTLFGVGKRAMSYSTSKKLLKPPEFQSNFLVFCPQDIPATASFHFHNSATPAKLKRQALCATSPTIISLRKVWNSLRFLSTTHRCMGSDREMKFIHATLVSCRATKDTFPVCSIGESIFTPQFEAIESWTFSFQLRENFRSRKRQRKALSKRFLDVLALDNGTKLANKLD